MSRLLLLVLTACSTAPAEDGPVIVNGTVTAVPQFVVQGSDVTVDREVTLTGEGFFGTAHGPWVHFGDVESPSVRIRDAKTVIALVPASVHGTQTVRLTNPDRTAAELALALD